MIYDLQKASLLKRAAAWMLDLILLAVLASGFATVLSGITGYGDYFDTMHQVQEHYEAEYGISLEDYSPDMTEEEMLPYKALDDALQADPEYIRCVNMILSLGLMMVSLSLLLSYLALEFLVPVLFKNGQTVGKKVFGIALVRTDGVKVSNFALFVRAVLGKYTLETMLPLLVFLLMMLGVLGVVGFVVLLVLLILEVTLMIVSKTNSTIHDCLAVTVAVDLSSQMIFDSPEELLKYKTDMQAEMANKAPY